MAEKGDEMVQIPNFYIGVGHVVHLSTDQSRGCHHCAKLVEHGGSNFGQNVNHYIVEHGYKLLHVGTETSHDADGKPWHATIAVLGRGTP